MASNWKTQQLTVLKVRYLFSVQWMSYCSAELQRFYEMVLAQVGEELLVNVIFCRVQNVR